MMNSPLTLYGEGLLAMYVMCVRHLGGHFYYNKGAFSLVTRKICR